MPYEITRRRLVSDAASALLCGSALSGASVLSPPSQVVDAFRPKLRDDEREAIVSC